MQTMAGAGPAGIASAPHFLLTTCLPNQPAGSREGMKWEPLEI